MIISEITGDIIKIAKQGNIIVHGCNCFNMMGAGLAAQVSKAFPTAAYRDSNTKAGDISKLGKWTSVVVNPPFEGFDDYGKRTMIINAYTQYEPGPNVNYDAISKAFSGLNLWLSGQQVYIPRIGAGIARGDWEAIKVIINLSTPNLDIVVVNYGNPDGNSLSTSVRSEEQSCNTPYMEPRSPAKLPDFE